MRLRNRTIGVGETFYPFKRLPPELRHIIWRLSLQPRVVEVLERGTYWEDADTHVGGAPNDPSVDTADRLALRYERQTYWEARHKDEGPGFNGIPAAENKPLVRYMSFANTMLPAALYVNRESRDTVLPLYPRCFASETHPPAVRINLSLDTLYVDVGIDDNFFNFLQALNPAELSKLTNLAISDDMGYCTSEFWPRVGKWVEKMTSLKSILIARDVSVYLECFFESLWPEFDMSTSRSNLLLQFPHDKKLQYLSKMMDDCAYNQHKCMALLDDFPNELLERLDFENDEPLLAEMDTDEELSSQEWVIKRTKTAWAWRHMAYPGITPVSV
ncbi:hypothetical protein BDZ45DRAFT_723528 [Acephala macrosclerotiorum]|nr:hypothetical protein BDZ45DRAFT_723528 [Acephala macrosclerotiorum]